jgi:hypothetical protein
MIGISFSGISRRELKIAPTSRRHHVLEKLQQLSEKAHWPLSLVFGQRVFDDELLCQRRKALLASCLTPITFYTRRRLRFRKDCLDGRVGVDDKAATTNRKLRKSNTESTESEVT